MNPPKMNKPSSKETITVRLPEDPYSPTESYDRPVQKELQRQFIVELFFVVVVGLFIAWLAISLGSY